MTHLHSVPLPHRYTQRATRSEIRILSCVDVSDLQKQADAMARRLRELDNTLQQCNWTTDVEI